MHDIFRLFKIKMKNAFLLLHCKVRIAISLEGSFDKLNKCIFNKNMGKSSVTNGKIIWRQTGRVDVPRFMLI